LPTFAKLAGATLPSDRSIDGRDATAFLLGESEKSPRDDYLYYTGCLLTAVRVNDWKLVLPRPANPPGTGWWGRMIEEIKTTQLYDLQSDPAETTNLADQHPEIIDRLMKRIEAACAELGDMKKTGSGARLFDAGPRIVGEAPRAKKGNASASESNAKPTTNRYDEAKPVGNLRFSFESGTLEDWEVVEGKFGQPVTTLAALPRHQDLPFARHGRHHLSTAVVSDDAPPSDQQIGVLESPVFVLEGDQIALLMGGGFDREQLYFGLVDSTTGEVLMKSGGKKDAQMRRIIWDVSKWKGARVRLRLVDHQTSGWGHLNVDDISVQGTLVGQTSTR
ncbi:MAG: hypothetical protein KDK97_21600, partial [Verrucomicrobiales bacterium]|nr:hypothetical protein [Verrucomicrobiales bacterium]